MRNRKLKGILVISVALVSIPAPAGGLDSLLDGMYVNTTDPGVYKSQTRGGFFGGSLVARTPIRSVNLVTFDPPRFAAGCGGVDMYMGSFSFINGDEIVATLRAVGQNAKGLLFKMAIDVINNFLGGAISQFSEKMQQLNQHLKNTCAIAEQIIPSTPEAWKLGAQRKGDALVTGAGKVDDYFSSIWKHIAKPDASLPGDPQTLSAGDKKLALQNSNIGNITWRAFYSSGAGKKLGDPGIPITTFDGSNADADKKVIQLLINVVGTTIIPTSNESTGPDCSGSSKCESSTKSFNGNNISIADLITPGEKTIYACQTTNITAEEELGCQSMSQVKLSAFFEGTSKYVNKMLFGINQAGDIDSTVTLTDGIVHKITSGQTLAADEIKFLNNTDIPIVAYLRKVQREPAAVAQIASNAAKVIAEDMAIRMARSMYSAANSGWAGNDVKVARSAQVDTNLAAFLNDVIKYEQNNKERLATLQKLNEIVVQLVSTLPRGGSFLPNNSRIGGA